jgi:hypothetical protein
MVNKGLYNLNKKNKVKRSSISFFDYHVFFEIIKEKTS